MFSVKRINKEDVAPVKFHDEVTDKRPIIGRDIFPEIYGNIFFCARKKSGKSCGIYHTIKHCATRETKVIAFVSTLHRDPTWRSIQKLCEEMKVDFTGYTSIRDAETKEDILDTIVKALEQKIENKAEVEKEPETNPLLMDFRFQHGAKKKAKPKPPKERAPKFIFVFDDLSGKLQTPSFTEFLKMNRHFEAKNIIASQYWNDIALQARKQLDYVLLYRGLKESKDKLQEIYRNCDLAVSYEVFYNLYRFATKEKFHFLYISVVNSEFRKDFTHEIKVPDEDEDGEREL